MPSPSTETDAVCEKKVRSTSGEDGKAIFSARHSGAKVALAGGWEAATRSGNACVARVHTREVGKGWQGEGRLLIVLWLEEVDILVMVQTNVFFDEWVPVEIDIVTAEYQILVRFAMDHDRDGKRGCKNVLGLGLV